MPSYCENELLLNGPIEDIARLLAHIGADQTPPKFDFSTVIPYPEPYASMDADYRALCVPGLPVIADRDSDAWKAYVAKWGTESDGFNAGGYDWCCTYWGTKWDACDVARADYLGTRLRFRTAWNAPEPVIVALARLFPHVSIALEWFASTGACGGFTIFSADEASAAQPAGVVSDRWGGEYAGWKGG